MRRNSKKGAIELGMNTIIIVVIGITLLSLALVWIRGMMGEKGIGGLTQGAFGQAETAIGDIYKGTTEDLSVVPGELSLAPGKSNQIKVVLANLVDSDYSNVNLKVALATEQKVKVKCQFANNLKDTTGPYTIPSGKQKELTMLVSVDPTSPLGVAVCTVTAPNTLDTEKSVIIKVEK